MNNTNHKNILITTKYLPIIIAILGLLNQITSYFDINVAMIDSIVTILYIVPLLLLSNLLKFCIYHKVIIAYILLNIMLLIIDTYLVIPLEDTELFIIYMVITGVVLGLVIYLYLRYGDRK